jgi:hypothetical protein
MYEQILLALKTGLESKAHSILKYNEMCLSKREINKLYIISLKKDYLYIFEYLYHCSQFRWDFQGNLENFSIACRYNSFKIIKFSLENKLLDDSHLNTYITLSVRDNNPEIVKLLLTCPEVDPTSLNNYCLNHSCEYGYPEIVKLLLTDSRIDPLIYGDTYIKLIIIKKYIELVKIFLTDPRFDPSENNNFLVRYAFNVKSKNTNIIKLLALDERVDQSTLPVDIINYLSLSEHDLQQTIY